jgi:lysophospholipase L1-like esterase
MADLTRRRSLALIGGALGALALGPAPADASHQPTLVAFGDSYTRSMRDGVPSWADQLHSDRKAKVLVNLGVSGATSEGFNSARTLDRQVDDWIARHKAKGLPDRTVIYFGYNDIDTFRPLGTAMNHYRIALDRLIAQGLAKDRRRILLCQLHDWSRNPAQMRNSVARVKSWNQFLRTLASERSNVVTVDLFSRFEDVFRNKKAYGFTHVTVADKARSATTHLYMDGNHFGKKGQAIIAKEILAKLK